MFPPFKWFLLFCWILCSSCTASEGKQLKFVHVVIRHGDRTPEAIFPTDTQNGESTWRQGLGELTQLGMQQHFAFGQWLKRRYRNFVSPEYQQKEIYLRSTGYNRTIQSALANVAGFYSSPSEDELIVPSLAWTPVPVHSQPRETDPLLWMDFPCPREAEIIRSVSKRADVRKFMADNKMLIDYAANKEGIPAPTSFINLVNLKTNLDIEYNHLDEHTPPSWATPELYKKLSDMYDQSLKFKYSTPEWQTLRGGLLYNEINERMVNKAEENYSKISPDLKIYFYIAHEWDNLALLQNMGCFNDRNPAFAAALLVELYEDAGEYFVEVHNQNKTNQVNPSPALLGQPYQLKIANCPQPCPLKTFSALAKARSPIDFYKECGYKSRGGSYQQIMQFASLETNDSNSGQTSLIVGLCIAVGSIAIFMAILMFENRKLRKLVNHQAKYHAVPWTPAGDSEELGLDSSRGKVGLFSFDEKSGLLK